jgi:hypothetical protein
LFLEMAFQAKRRVALVQQSLVDGAVGRMTDHATFPHCLVLVNKGAPLRGMALEAGFVSAQESKAPAFEHLLNIGPATLDCDTDVRIMAIRAAHFAFQHRMVVRQLELCPHFQVTLETRFRRLPRIDDRVRRATALDVQTSRTVTRFATNVLCVLAMRLQAGMRRRPKIARNIFVTRRAFLGSHELRAGNAGRRKNSAVCFQRAARKQNHGERGHPPNAPKKLFALTVGPSS